jgi:hypothetical protein
MSATRWPEHHDRAGGRIARQRLVRRAVEARAGWVLFESAEGMVEQAQPLLDP